MANIEASMHALKRYQQRVEAVPFKAVKQALESNAAVAAARMAGRDEVAFVRLPTGHRLVIKNWTVLTVLPANSGPRELDYYRRKYGN